MKAIFLILALALLSIPTVAQTAVAETSKDSKTSTIVPAVLPPSKPPSDSVLVVKHSFNHRQQIITGSVVMACLALIMVTMNNYNPR